MPESDEPALDTGLRGFEELISFHGGIGGPQTRPFILHPAELQLPETELIGAAPAVHEALLGWRRSLNGAASPGVVVGDDQERRGRGLQRLNGTACDPRRRFTSSSTPSPRPPARSS